jgi:hypothetical protein
VDVQWDPMNCGMCGLMCGPGTTCSWGKCAGSCPPPSAQCGTVCVDLLTDPNHCGTCGKACAVGLTCQSGVCGACTFQNVALLGKPSISTGGVQEPYVPARANDGVMETENCTDWAWIDGTDKPAGGWIQYDWPWTRRAAW